MARSSTDGGRVEIDGRHPAVPAMDRAEVRYRERDVPGCDAAWAEAVRLARGDRRLRARLAMDHVARLFELRALPEARARCEEYLEGAEGNRVPLGVLRAEILVAQGRAPEAAREAAAIRCEVLAEEGTLAEDDEARLCRVQGLALGEQGDGPGAAVLLERARALFEERGDTEAAEGIGRESERIAAAGGDVRAARSVVVSGRRETVADEFRLGIALKCLCRYEEALQVMVGCARPDLPAPMRWPVLREIALLHRTVGRGDIADRLVPVLARTAAQAADRAGAEAELDRMRGAEAPRDGTFMERIQYARRLLDEGGLRHAERIVRELRERAVTGLEVALWHLAAGELEFGLHRRARKGSADRADRDHRADAVLHLQLSIERAAAHEFAEVRVQALRALGHVHVPREEEAAADGEGDAALAGACWNEARRLEERIVHRQVSDEVRRGMSLAIADTHDEWIAAAMKTTEDSGAVRARAAVVATMEAARGGSILSEILPDDTDPARDLPGLGDFRGAWNWVGSIADRLPGSQAVWLMHAAPRAVHHAVIGRDFLCHVVVNGEESQRSRLRTAIDEFSGCCGTEQLVEKNLKNGEFDRLLAAVAEAIGVRQVIERLPRGVRRLAVVAGDMLSDVPIGGIGIDGVPLGVRFALSDLPCLSAMAPLHARARRARGSSRLLVSPRTERTSAPGRTLRRETVLDKKAPQGALSAALGERPRRLAILDQHATPDALRAALEKRHYHLVRIHSHGSHDHADSGRSKVQLAPAGDEGALRADDLQQRGLLHGCGTIVLGACETGMALRVGHDERTGFVRAAFVAGAASAVAARWVAPAGVAAELLDRFERYARHLPRDIALQQAQRDLYEGVRGTPGERDALRRHPANWACWTLYGDSGLHTAAGPVRRKLRTLITRRRHAGQR